MKSKKKKGAAAPSKKKRHFPVQVKGGKRERAGRKRVQKYRSAEPQGRRKQQGANQHRGHLTAKKLSTGSGFLPKKRWAKRWHPREAAPRKGTPINRTSIAGSLADQP